jgi:hypothetical protein
MGHAELVIAPLRLRTLRHFVLLALGITVGLCFAISSAMADTSVVATTGGPPLATPETVAATPSALLRGIGSDGGEGVWFFDEEFGEPNDTAYLAHYSPSQSGLTRIAVKSLSDYGEYIQGIAPGLNGTEWFARFYDNEISHTTASGKLITKKLPPQTEPQDVVVDRQGVAWFTSRGHGCELGRLPPKGKLTFYTVGGDCYDLTVGPDGNIWVAAYTANVVDELSVTTGAVLASYPMRLPAGIATLGQDIYVTETEPGVVSKITPTGQVTEYTLPAGRTLEWMTAGPDGAVWFDENTGPTGEPAVGRLTPNGELREVPVPGGGGVDGITATSDAIYFTQGGPTGHDGGVMRIPLSNFSPPDSSSYVALGDSFSSGEGNPPYERGSDERGLDECHRSESAYSTLLNIELGILSLTFRACSGATTADIIEANPDNHEPSQLSWLSGATKLVTLTIGGIDAGFVHLLYECVAGLRGGIPPFKGFGCAEDQTLVEQTHNALNALEGTVQASTQGRRIYSILSIIEAIHAKAANAHIVVGGYPLIFGPHFKFYTSDPLAPGGRTCVVEPNGIAGVPVFSVSYLDAQWLNEQGARLDSIILAAVRAAATTKKVPVKYAAPTSQFGGHALCDSEMPWFHPLELEEDLSPAKGSFHPNQSGQTLGYVAAFRKQIK